MTFKDSFIDFIVNTSKKDFGEVSNPLNNYRQTSSKSLIVNNSIFDVFPGVNNETKSVLFEESWEELPFPFPISKW